MLNHTKEHIILVIDEWMLGHSSKNWIFMQDNALCHKARSTIEEIRRRGIKLLKWPTFL
jgi:hypothetical protein